MKYIMKNVLVFSNNSWIHVDIPVGHDPSWSTADMSFYGTMFAAASQLFPTERAVSIAEAVVSKRLYPGLVYDKVLERDIASIARKEHESPQH